MHSLLLDLRYALRTLRRSPGFALVAVLSLTMAIAANVIVFGVLDALVFHPLPVPDARRVFTIQGRDADDLNVSYPDFVDIRARAHALSGMAVSRIVQFGLGKDKGKGAEPLWGYEASSDYFSVLGVRPFLGRFFGPEDEHGPNSSPYAVLSYDCWRSRFGADTGVIGRTIRLNNHPYTVIGVTGPGFSGTERIFAPELWVPSVQETQFESYNWIEGRSNHGQWAIARLRPGVTREQADAELAGIARQLAKEYPESDHGLTLRLAQPGFLGDLMGGPMHAFLGGVMLLASLVLLAACANLGGIFAARTADRARELGIRIAIGSSRVRLLRGLLTETLVTALVSAAMASFVARSLLQALARFRPPISLPIHVAVDAGPMSYVFAFLLAGGSGVLLGLLPMRQIWRTDPSEAIRASSGALITGRRFALRDVLLALQVALCCLLVTSSLVAVRGLYRALTMPLGIRPQGVTAARFDFHLAGYNDKDVPPEQRRILDAVLQLPGVSAAAYASSTPLHYDISTTGIYPEGTVDFKKTHSSFGASYFDVSPGYLAAAGTPLLAGREFSWSDSEKTPRVAIVNETFARKLYGTVKAVGRRFVQGDTVTVVGIVPDGKYQTLTEEPSAAVFFPILQNSSATTMLLVRSLAPPETMIPAVRDAVERAVPGLPVTEINSWQRELESFALVPAWAATIALGVLGALAIMLAITGVFGLASYAVARRRREIGIRIALGAQSRQVLRAALGRIGWLLTVGSAAGLVLGIAASRVLASIVYQARASDPIVIGGVVVTMAAVGALSAWWPARRALAIEPAELLRNE